MTIQRVVGTTGEMVDIFVQDATVSTGAGLPNLVISTFSSYYHRTDMTSTSSVTLVSTGTLGTWSSGQWLQVNSTFMRGWYQFCAPNGMYANGSSVALHMYGHPSMAPVVMRYDITRLNNQSTVVNASRVGVSSFGIPVGVSSMAIGVGVTTFNSRVGVSSFDLPVGVSSISVGVSTSWFSGAGIVTTLAGRLSVDVSSIMGTKIVTTFPGYPATYFDLGLINNSTSTVSLSSFSIAAQSVTVGSVDVTSFYGLGVVTTADGILSVGRVGVSSFNLPVGVSAFGIPVGVSTIEVGVSTSWFSGGAVVTSAAGVLASHVTSMRIAVDRQIVDALLGRNVSSGGDGDRTVAQALYVLRNKTEVNGGVMTVYGTDDTTSSWAADVSTTPGDPISGIDPS